MQTHETVRKMTDGQRSDLIATMVGAMPSDLTFEEAQAIIGKKGPFVAEIREVFAKRRLNTMPTDDEWFELEIDNNIDPMSVVITAGYDQKGWKYLGPELSGKQTLRVKLVRLGYVRNLDAAEKKADEMGCRLVEGQAREPFKAKFPKPRGRARVASLYGFGVGWYSCFHWSDRDFDDSWRCLVVGK